MTYYAIITNDELNGKGQCPCSGTNTFSVEITGDIYNNIERYIYSNGKIIVNPEWDNIQLDKAKQQRIVENDKLRDTALLGGVIYNNVLFDSDTDQKVNLLSIISQMSESDTMLWYGMDNEALLCTKEDLLSIGYLIEQLHSFCWRHNAEIKQRIKNAQTLEELEEIEIDYTLIGE